MSRRTAIWIFIGVLFVAAIVTARVASPASESDTTEAGAAEYAQEVIEDGGADAPTVAVIPIEGIIVNGDGSPGEGAVGSNETLDLLEEVAEDDTIEALILRIDTPGGGVIPSDEIHSAVERLTTGKDKKPVVAWMRQTAASGGYYIAAGADHIVAHELTDTGSIGVIAHLLNVQGLADKVGVREIIIKSGKLKDMGSPFRDLTPEERNVIQRIIDEAYERFVRVVAEGRDMPVARVKELADGRIYSGGQAKQLGLVDELGSEKTAFEAVAKLLDEDDVTVVEFQRKLSFADFIAGLTGAAGRLGPAKVIDDVEDRATPRLEYRAAM